MKKEDVMLLILLILSILLIVYTLTLTRGHSPEYVTYRDFYDFTMRMTTIILSFAGVALASVGSIWYKLGEIEQKIESSTSPVI